ncbi:MAG: TIGR03032 family protein [Pseudomonadota bacterium]
MTEKTANDDEARYESLDFSCEYSPNLPTILNSLDISLAFTSYQAGRFMFVRSDGESLDVNFKSFHRPMGLAATEGGLTLGVFTQVINFARVDGLIDRLKQPLQPIEDDITAPRIHPKGEEPEKESEDETDEPSEEELARRAHQEALNAPVDERVDACFITRSAHYTGMINLHDIDWGNDGLWVVNSSFSCLCTLDPDYSFVPRWKPHFISKLVPEDRCHLNGMTLKDGEPAYVTTFSTADEPGQWRQGDKRSGTVMSVEHNEIIVDGLIMPHSPRWHDGYVYFCNSGEGLLCRLEPSGGAVETVAELQGFTRGMDFYGPLVFVGLSSVREGNVLEPPPLKARYDETFSGIWIVNTNDQSVAGFLKFTGNVDQIYDVAVIPGCSFPELIEPTHPRMRNHFQVP